MIWHLAIFACGAVTGAAVMAAIVLVRIAFQVAADTREDTADGLPNGDCFPAVNLSRAPFHGDGR